MDKVVLKYMFDTTLSCVFNIMDIYYFCDELNNFA